MSSHVPRRALAACTSVLLVLGLLGLTSSASQADDATYSISGQLRDQCGSGLQYPSVDVFDAGLPDAPATARKRGDYYGYYTLEGLTGSVRLRLGTYSAPSVERWYEDGTSFETATTIEPGDSTGRNVIIRRALDLSAGGVQSIYGVVSAPDKSGIVGLAVRVYRATGDAQDPWALETTVRTLPVDTINPSGRPAGYFRADLPAGEYRVMVNETDDGTPASHAWQPLLLPSSATPSNVAVICLEKDNSRDASATLAYAGGVIAGRLTTPRGNPVKSASVEVYDASIPTGSPASVVTTDANGEYTAHALSGPTKLRFVKTGYTVPEWFGDATSFDAAASLTVPAGGTSTGNDAVLPDAPLRSTRVPTIRGLVKYGTEVSAGAGVWAPGYPVTRSYRWMRKTGSRLTTISSASSSRYTLRPADIGRRIVLRETVKPVGTYPDVLAASRYSTQSTIVKRLSKVSVTASSSGKRITIKVKVTMKGVAHPKGSVRLRAQRYDGSGRRVGGHKHKTVSFKNGNASWSFTGGAGGWAYDGAYGGSSTVASASDDGYMFKPR